MRYKSIAALFLVACLLPAARSFSQSPGLVVRPAGGPYSIILDPNQNGYTSSSTSGFTTSDIGTGNSEIPYKVVPPAIIEPTGDLATGPSGGFTDIVRTVDGSGFYTYYDGTNILFRLRIGAISSGSKGYSILLDTDGKMGNSGPNADPNYIAPTNASNGNPGFEYEVVLQTNFNVSVYNVDGTSTPVLVTTYPLSTNSLISVALSTDSGNPDYFYDFTVPVSILGSPSSFRMAATTVTSPNSALQGSRSDIYGINDNSNSNVASAWQTIINSEPAITLANISSAGAGVGPTATAAPTLTAPITTGSGIVVGGVWNSLDVSKPSTATITLYKNGVPVNTTSVTSGGSWSMTVPTVAAGDVFYARAQASGESMSLQSSSVTAGCASVPASPVLTCASSKGISGSLPSGATILVYQIPTTTASATSIPLTTNITYPTSTTFSYYVNNCSGGTNNVANGTYMLLSSNGGCTSSPIFECINSGSSALTGLAANTISVTTPVYPYQTTINGTGATIGNILRLFINGVTISSLTAAASTFSFTGLTLKASDQIKIYSQAGTGCMTASSTFTVSCYAQPPVITTNANGKLLSTATSISGTSVYGGATVTLYKGISPAGVAVGSPVVTNSTGAWTASGLTLAAGDNYYATISSGGCLSAASSGAGVLAPTTTCPVITGSYTETSTSVLGTLPSAFTGTVRLYLDGSVIGSVSVSAATSWSINAPYTYSLYPGGVLTVTSQSSGLAENFTCGSSATIGCTAPSTPSINPTSTTINTGQTVTFNVSNVSSNTWYALLDNTGTSYATSVYKTNTSTFDLTTSAFNTTGTYNLNLTANKLTGCPLSFQSASIQVSSPLPVELLYFRGSEQDGTSLLQWSTASEQNAKYFEIERGIDGNVFVPVGTVSATGNSSAVHIYNFTDTRPGSGKIYYRLNTVDLDGSAKYSQVIAIEIDPVRISAAIPNPFASTLHLNILLNGAQQFRLELLDVTGREVRSLVLSGQKGMNSIQINDLASIAAGVYIIRIFTKGQFYQQKLIKSAGH